MQCTKLLTELTYEYHEKVACGVGPTVMSPKLGSAHVADQDQLQTLMAACCRHAMHLSG